MQETEDFLMSLNIIDFMIPSDKGILPVRDRLKYDNRFSQYAKILNELIRACREEGVLNDAEFVFNKLEKNRKTAMMEYNLKSFGVIK